MAVDPEGWREDLGSRFAGLQVASTGAAHGSIRSAHVGVVDVFDIRGDTQLLRRTARASRQRPLELLKVCVQVRGEASVEQASRTVTLRPGQMALYDTSKPYSLWLRGPWQCAVMTLTRDALHLPERAVAQAMDRPHSVADGAGSMLTSYLVQCLSSGEVPPRVGDAGVALLAGTLAGGLVPTKDVGADLLREQVRDYVRSHLDDPALCPASVAAAHHIALRTLHRLFEGSDASVAALVRELRLEAIRRDLDDPFLADVPIGRLAARWCVTDQPWLSRAFRSRFGASPSEYRTPCHPARCATD